MTSERLSSRRHGGNKDEQADALERMLSASLAFAGDAAACAIDSHRPSDWRLAGGGKVVCGICHPPATGLTVESVAA